LEKEYIDDLKKKYPADSYDISTTGGRLVIAEKKKCIWIRKRLLKSLPQRDAAALSDKLLLCIDRAKLGPEHFKQVQVAVTARFAKKLAEKAKEAGVHQLTYLTEAVERAEK